MYKQFLLNNIINEMKIVRRLSTKIPADQINFRPKENLRSNLELLQYLCLCGTMSLRYWYRKEATDFRTYFAKLNDATKSITHDQFIAEMDSQIELVKQLFENITEEELMQKEVDYPSGVTAKLGEAIIQTTIKWLTAYKMQLFVNIKLCTDEKLSTADLWRKTDLND